MHRIIIHRAASSLTLHGGPAQDAWRTATWHSPFVQHGEPGVESVPGTSFSLAHDGVQIMACIRAEEPEIANLDTTGVHVPRDVWSRNHLELFLDPGGMGRTCLQVGVTMDGNVAQVWRSGNFELHDPDLGTQAVADTDAHGWWACIAVPLASLDFSNPSPAWKVNVARLRILQDDTVQVSSFAPIQQAALYDPASFPAATAEDLDPTGHQWEIKLRGAATVTARDAGQVFRQNARIANRSTKDQAISVQTRLDDQASSPLLSDTTVAANTACDTVIETALSSQTFRRLNLTVADAATGAPLRQCAFVPETESFSWKEHHTWHGNGKGGFTSRPARYQFLPQHNGAKVTPYGLAQMDNGEIILVGSTTVEGGRSAAVIAFSDDLGETWSDYIHPEHPCTHPMMLIYFGHGDLAFRSSWEPSGPHYFVSHDYGRTWPEKRPVAPSSDGLPIACEGSPLVDRDSQGIATAIAETGQTALFVGGIYQHCRGCLHWTRDQGRTWEDFSYPDAWLWHETFDGKTSERGSGEGALIRAANGDLVAMMRMDCEGRYTKYAYDQFEGLGVSISGDEGRSWSPIRRVCEAGRMHANLVRLPNNDLIMTAIRRMDHRGGKLASYRRGCDAFVSHDHGQTWDQEEMIVLDDWPHHDPNDWYGSVCGHLYSVVLSDASVLTGYSKHDVGGVLIHWQP